MNTLYTNFKNTSTLLLQSNNHLISYNLKTTSERKMLELTKSAGKEFLIFSTALDVIMHRNNFKIIKCISSTIDPTRTYQTTTVDTKVGDKVKTTSDLYASSIWCEREMYDLFGIKFMEASDLRRLLTNYGYRGYPLKKISSVYGSRDHVTFDVTSKTTHTEALLSKFSVQSKSSYLAPTKNSIVESYILGCLDACQYCIMTYIVVQAGVPLSAIGQVSLVGFYGQEVYTQVQEHQIACIDCTLDQKTNNEQIENTEPITDEYYWIGFGTTILFSIILLLK